MGATTTSRLLSSAATTNAALVQAGPVTLRRIVGYCASSSGKWLKLYDKATAPASTDTPRKTYYLPPTSGFSFDLEDEFALGLGYRITGASGDSDTTALASGDILGLNVDYR